MDLRKRLNDLLLAVAPEDVTVYITDAAGHTLLVYHDGESHNQSGNQLLQQTFEPIKELFETDAMRHELRAGRQLYGKIVSLGSVDSVAKIGIVVHVEKSK